MELYGRGHRYSLSGALRLCGGDAIQGPHDEDCHLCLGHLPGHHPRGLDARDARGHLLSGATLLPPPFVIPFFLLLVRFVIPHMSKQPSSKQLLVRAGGAPRTGQIQLKEL